LENFKAHEFLPASLMKQITEIRVTDPDRPFRAARRRKRRTQITIDGKLNILAADHPARRVSNVGSNRLGMADRQDYLGRIVRVLLSEFVDGVMATMDILEDLFTLDDLLRRTDGQSLLDEKVLIVSLNRGGLAGTIWEMDDPLTGASSETCSIWGLDGAKVLLRICDDEPGSLKTMLACADTITKMNALNLPTFLEPLPVVKAEKGYKVIKESEALAKAAGVASALGDSSRYLWLKLPFCENYEVVASATTLPILLLGGEAVGDATPLLKEIAAGLASGSNVRGALVGRNVLYPGAEDPFAIGTAAGGMIHQGWTIEQALNHKQSPRTERLELQTEPGLSKTSIG
jgi:hypothetical protein